MVLLALGASAHDAAALAGWAARVKALCVALHWPAPEPVSHLHAQGATLAFAAPEYALLTATEVNEWAWERSAAPDGAWVPLQPASDDMALLATEFMRRATAELSGPVQRLKAAALTHGLPVFEDDDSLSIGAGRGSHTWPHAALPLPMDVQWAALHDIPTVLVTGSNGKTTTTRLLAAMVQAAGLHAGLCSTEGVWIDGEMVGSGDYAGPAGARAVLRHTGVDVAVLETARGGILRRGLAVQRADAAVVINVSADHLGDYGIDTVRDIAAAKLAVAHAVAVSGTLVLNGGDEVLVAVAGQTQAVQSANAQGRLALFARDFDAPTLVRHRQSQPAQGGTCGVRAGRLLVQVAETTNVCMTNAPTTNAPTTNSAPLDLGAVADMPLALGGAAAFNIENIAAAVLCAFAAGLPPDAVRSALHSFGASPQDNVGRLERWSWRGATVLVDYAHNPNGLVQLLAVARALNPCRLGLLLGQAGNRDDAAIAELATVAAQAQPDIVVIKELPAMLRGRPLGSVPALVEAALYSAGLPTSRMHHQADELLAAQQLLAWADAGDVVVLPIHTAAVRMALAAQLKAG